ncbi:MAG: acetyltransferase, ribosomal protein N-acetylase [Myxococcales bacterium]|nr:acetyltransferase, ribosomal protein N-acetylase [Myxococcales bacterium]
MEDDAPRLFTGRLELIAATPELARAAATSNDALAELLEVEVPRGWPPELMADHQNEWAAELEKDPTLVGWQAWYVVQVTPGILVGSIGFMGKPDEDGTIECGYSFVPKYQRRGYATEAFGGLIDWAFSHDHVRRIRAHTLAHLSASIRVMEKNGLSHVGEGDEAGTLRFELTRP